MLLPADLQILADEFILNALKEDVREGDHSSNACIPATQNSKARLLVKDNGILAGMDLAEYIFAKAGNNIPTKKRALIKTTTPQG